MIKLDDESILEAVVEAQMLTLANRSMEGPIRIGLLTPALDKRSRHRPKAIPSSRGSKRRTRRRLPYSPFHQYETSMLVSMKEGNSELIIGQDFSIGYQSHTNTEVNFYITDLHLRVLAPESIKNSLQNSRISKVLF